MNSHIYNPITYWTAQDGTVVSVEKLIAFCDQTAQVFILDAAFHPYGAAQIGRRLRDKQDSCIISHEVLVELILEGCLADEAVYHICGDNTKMKG